MIDAATGIGASGSTWHGMTRASRWAAVALLLVILTSVGAGVVILVSQRGSSHSIHDLSTGFMKEVAARAQGATLGYLEAGPRSLEAIRGLARGGRLDLADDSALEQELRTLLLAYEELEMFNFGWPSGDFLMVKRMPDGSFSSKRIRRRDSIAESLWVHENPIWYRNETYADRREPAEEAYDPRRRPWYRLAAETGTLSWIEPYIFYSDRLPGINCNLPLYDPEGRLKGVVSADVGIADLSRLLATFDIGHEGQAMILTADGRLIAYPGFLEEGFEIVREVAGAERPELRRIDDSPDSILAAAFERRPASGEAEPFTFEHDGVGYVARFESFPVSSGLHWLVGVLAPQADFMGSVRRDYAVTRGAALVCLVLAIGLAAVLIYHAASLELQLAKARTVEKQCLIDELEARNAEMERFTYTVSHDLKSPLITISGFLGLAKKDALAGDLVRMERGMGRIQTAIERMGRLLDELLALSQVGRVTNPLENTPIVEVAREAVTVLHGLIAGRGVEVSIAPDMPAAFCNPHRILEVLQNLIENAIKFMGDRPEPRIEIAARRDGAEIVYYVRDNGIGIEPRFHRKVFGLFDRLDPEIEGTGVGLALVKRIVEVHDGRIWVESEGLGQGSTFCFTLPGSAPRRRPQG